MVSGTAIPGVSAETLILVSADSGDAQTSVAVVRQWTEPAQAPRHSVEVRSPSGIRSGTEWLLYLL